jgi:hypothetical protein
MSNVCETNTNVTNLELTGTFENEYKSSTNYCLKDSVPGNQTIYVLSKDKYDILKSSSSSTSKCNCNTWIIVSVVFILLFILVLILVGILTSKLLKKKK